MIRSLHRCLVISATAAVGVIIAGSTAFSYEERPAPASAHVERVRSAGAAIDLFLRIDGIEGDSRDAKHAGWIDIHSFSWGVTAASSTVDRSLASLQDLHLSTPAGKASARLAEAGAVSRRFPTATLSVVRVGAEPVEYLTYTLRDVGISTYVTSGSEGGNSVDSFSLSYRSLDIAYREQRADGSLAAPILVTLTRP